MMDFSPSYLMQVLPIEHTLVQFKAKLDLPRKHFSFNELTYFDHKTSKNYSIQFSNVSGGK